MDEARLEALLKEATAHCYDEEDVFWGMFSALVGRLSLPLQASVRGEAVTFVGLDGPTSDLVVRRKKAPGPDRPLGRVRVTRWRFPAARRG
jgi:hypothetical protein